MATPDPKEVLALHRYFLWAAQMREHFYQLTPDVSSSTDVMFRTPYMSYWYGGTYVIIEGWRELGLADEEIDRLLESPYVDSLKRYRNGSFHFQRKYMDDRFVGFVTGDGSAEWIFKLTQAFSRWFLEYLRSHTPRT